MIGFVHRWFIEPRNQKANELLVQWQDTYPEIMFNESQKVEIGGQEYRVPAWDCATHKKVVDSMMRSQDSKHTVYRMESDGVIRLYDYAKEHRDVPKVIKGSDLKE